MYNILFQEEFNVFGSCFSVELSPLVLNGLLESLMQLLSGAMEKPPPPLPSLLHMKVMSLPVKKWHILGITCAFIIACYIITIIIVETTPIPHLTS